MSPAHETPLHHQRTVHRDGHRSIQSLRHLRAPNRTRHLFRPDQRLRDIGILAPGRHNRPIKPPLEPRDHLREMQQLHGEMLRAGVNVGHEFDGGAVCAVSVGHDGCGGVGDDVVVHGVVDVERDTGGVFCACA